MFTRLKRHQPILLNIHCLCHKLALAAGESGKDVAFIFQKIKPTLTQLFYFYQNSSVRMSGLQAIENPSSQGEACCRHSLVIT